MSRAIALSYAFAVLSGVGCASGWAIARTSWVLLPHPGIMLPAGDHFPTVDALPVPDVARCGTGLWSGATSAHCMTMVVAGLPGADALVVVESPQAGSAAADTSLSSAEDGLPESVFASVAGELHGVVCWYGPIASARTDERPDVFARGPVLRSFDPDRSAFATRDAADIFDAVGLVDSSAPEREAVSIADAEVVIGAAAVPWATTVSEPATFSLAALASGLGAMFFARRAGRRDQMRRSGARVVQRATSADARVPRRVLVSPAGINWFALHPGLARYARALVTAILVIGLAGASEPAALDRSRPPSASNDARISGR